jgi:hypothetical protein
MPKAMPNARPMMVPIASPAKAENSVSRVAARIERSAKAPNSAMTISLGGARLSLCRWVTRAHTSNTTSTASGSASALAELAVIARSH